MSLDFKSGIVRILSQNGSTTGVGFVVSEEGLIATCSHVVQDENSQRRGDSLPEYVDVVFYATGERRRAWVEPEWWRPSTAQDVAVLRMEGPLPEEVTPLPLGSSFGGTARIFHAFGFPDAAPTEGLAARGEIIGKTTYQGYPVLQLRSSEITAGFSGAPVWDDDLGIVIGMITSITKPDRYVRLAETAYVTPVETLREACSLLRLPEGSPYRGLEVFDVEHANLYFGREAATRELLQVLSKQNMVLLVGVSGSGKSSLVQAGLEKGLRTHQVPGLAERTRCLTTPGRYPMFNLVLALANLLGMERVAQAFDISPSVLKATGSHRWKVAERLDAQSPRKLAKALKQSAPPEGMILIVDQFERLYTECLDENVRHRFVKTLLRAAGDKVKVLLVLRADFYARVLSHPDLAQAVKQGGQVTLGRMEAGELQMAIEEPARRMGRVFQPGLVDRIIADVQGRVGDLPLLQFALTELWKQDNQKGVLTLATYEALGYTTPDGRRFPGVQGALARRAEEVWRKLNKRERQAAQRIFIKLVFPEAGGKDGREDASRRAWQLEWHNDEVARHVVRKLVVERLLVAGRDPATGQPTLEVAHETLIQAWPRLHRWVKEYKPFIQWYDSELAPFLQRWVDRQRQDLLFPKTMLPLAQAWLKRYPALLEGQPADYIRASIKKVEAERAAQKRQRQRIKRLRQGVTLSLATGFMVVLILAWVAWGQRNLALHQQYAADTARATAMAESYLRATAQASAERQRDIALARAWALKGRSYLRDNNSVDAPLFAAFLGLASYHSLSSKDAEALLRDVLIYDFQPPLLSIPNAAVAEFSPDGSIIAVGLDDGCIQIWSVDKGKRMSEFCPSRDSITLLRFSPGGESLVGVDASGNIFLLSAPNLRVRHQWRKEQAILDVQKTPLGIYALLLKETSSFSKKLELMNLQTADTLSILEDIHEGMNVNGRIAPNGKFVISTYCVSRNVGGACVQSQLKVWEITPNGVSLAMQQPHYLGITGVSISSPTFNPESIVGVTADAHGDMILWDTFGNQFPFLINHPITAVARAEQKVAYTTSLSYEASDITIAKVPIGGETVLPLWRKRIPRRVTQLLTDTQGKFVAVLSPMPPEDERATQLDVWRVNSPVRALDVSSLLEPQTITQLPSSVVVTCGLESCMSWDYINNKAKILPFRGLLVGVSNDGQYFATTDEIGITVIWRIDNPSPILTLPHADRVYFSQDGKRVFIWASTSGMQQEDPFGQGKVCSMETGQCQDLGNRVGAAAFVSNGFIYQNGENIHYTNYEGISLKLDSPCKRILAFYQYDSQVRFVCPQALYTWDRENSLELRELYSFDVSLSLVRNEQIPPLFMPSHSVNNYDIVVSKSGEYLIYYNKKGRPVLLDGLLERREIRGKDCGRFTFSPDQQWVAGVCTNENSWTVKLWDVTSLEEFDLFQISSPGHLIELNLIGFSPKSRWLAGSKASYCMEGTCVTEIGLWAHPFGPDLSKAVCERLPRNPTQDEWRQLMGTDIPYQALCPNLEFPPALFQGTSSSP